MDEPFTVPIINFAHENLLKCLRYRLKSTLFFSLSKIYFILSCLALSLWSFYKVLSHCSLSRSTLQIASIISLVLWIAFCCPSVSSGNCANVQRKFPSIYFQRKFAPSDLACIMHPGIDSSGYCVIVWSEDVSSVLMKFVLVFA